MSSLLDHDFDTEYDLSLSAWGDGMLSESELLDFQKPDTIVAEYKKETSPLPKEHFSIDEGLARLRQRNRLYRR